MTTRSVQKQIRVLAKADLLKITEGGGRHRVNHYQLKLPNPEQNTVNAIQRIQNTESGARKGERRSRKGEPRSPQLLRNCQELRGGAPPSIETVQKSVKGNGASLPFLSALQKLEERAARECQSLLDGHTLENSLSGRQWTNSKAKQEWQDWDRIRKETRGKIQRHEYRD